jgi:hypothetical protein
VLSSSPPVPPPPPPPPPPVGLPESTIAMTFVTPGILVFLHDTLNNLQFLVDSGASL